MFTGLVQSLGSIKTLEKDRFIISVVGNHPQVILSDLAIGDSVAVDGVCLTVEEILPLGFKATASEETLKRTTLGKRNEASQYVNLETSLRLGSKLGGHFVTGHVDGIGCLIESESTYKAWEMLFAAPPSASEEWQNYIAPYLVNKGSITVNGISLTVAECQPDGSYFKVAVIPHTYEETNLYHLNKGDWVNIEGDILGKYVERLISQRLGKNNSKEDISLGFLSEHGYF